MDSYLLMVKWVDVEYDVLDDSLIRLKGTYFSGPVLKYASKIQPNDNINLDFTAQYCSRIEDYYIANLKWVDVKYMGGIVYLNDCYLKCKYKDILPKIKNDDFFVVDTSQHEEDTHAFFFNYYAELYSAFGEAYDFRSM